MLLLCLDSNAKEALLVSWFALLTVVCAMWVKSVQGVSSALTPLSDLWSWVLAPVASRGCCPGIHSLGARHGKGPSAPPSVDEYVTYLGTISNVGGGRLRGATTRLGRKVERKTIPHRVAFNTSRPSETRPSENGVEHFRVSNAKGQKQKKTRYRQPKETTHLTSHFKQPFFAFDAEATRCFWLAADVRAFGAASDKL